MSYGSTDAVPMEKPKLLNLAPERNSTNEEARPLPVFWGQHRIGSTWLDRQRKEKTEERTEEQEVQEGGKGGGSSTEDVVVGIEYYCALLAVVCVGPVDLVKTMWANGTQLWGQTRVRSGSSNDTQFDLDKDRGSVTFWWGTSGQNLNFDGGHPRYARQCAFRIEDFFLGVDTTSIPSFELEVGRWPSFSWITGGNSKIDDDCNPIAILADAITHPLLYAMSDTVLDKVQLAAVAQTLKNEGAGLSPMISRGQRLDQFLTELCSYFDGVPRWVDGKLQIFLQRNAPDRSTLMVVDEDLLTDVPQVNAGDWAATANQVRITYTRKNAGYKEASYTWNDHGNVLMTGSTRAQTISRPWITSEGKAVRLAQQTGRKLSIPPISGRCTVLDRPTRHLRVGDFFRLVYANPALDLVCRITERRLARPDSREAEWAWDAEPNQEGESVEETDPSEELIPEDPDPAAQIRLLELPWPLAVAPLLSVAAIVARGNAATNRIILNGTPTTSDYRVVAAVARSFARGGVLGADFPAGALIDRSAGMLLDLTSAVDSDLDSQTLDSALLGRVLVFVGNEIMSMSEAEMVSPGLYRLKGLVRARYDTVQQSHVAGAQVQVIVKQQIIQSRDERYAPGQTWNYKVQPASFASALALVDITAAPLTLTGRTLAPLVPRNLRAGSATYTPGTDLLVSWGRTSWRNPNFWVLFAAPYRDPDVGFVVEVWSGSTLKRSVTLGAVDGWTYTGAQIAADFPSGADMVIHLYALWDSYRSQNFATLTLTLAEL